MTDWDAIAGKVASAVAKGGGRTANVTVYTDNLNPDGSIIDRAGEDFSVLCSPVFDLVRSSSTDGTPIVSGKTICPAAGIEITPAKGQTWEIDGARYTSGKIETYSAGGVLQAFLVNITKGGV